MIGNHIAMITIRNRIPIGPIVILNDTYRFCEMLIQLCINMYQNASDWGCCRCAFLYNDPMT